MEYSDLVKGYQQLINKHNASALTDDHPEQVVTIHETVWLRILLIHSLKNPDVVRLVVEVSFPNWVYEIPVSFNNDEIIKESSLSLPDVLKEMVIHLEYLHKLSDVGFRLELLAEEGIWSASTELKQPPSKELFKALVPTKSMTKH
ncbi:MAG: hypothetical protein ACXACF_07880 [Candidatus Hermodarchaeia archaeon]|jgi:predicted AlkP superfamily pyrophosphatase or phosphodiesterase